MVTNMPSQRNRTNIPDNRPIWEGLYASGKKINRYPHDAVVSFVLRTFGDVERNKVRILDYGCGGGGNTVFIASSGFDLYAVDSSPTAVKLTAAAIRKIAPQQSRQVMLADFATLPFADGFFSAIIDRQSLGQNLSDTLPGMVSEIRRVLAPGGIYFGINFSNQHPQLRYGEPLGNGGYHNFSEGVFKGIGARHFFDEAEIRQLFADFDLIDIRIVTTRPLLNPESGSEEICVTARRP